MAKPTDITVEILKEIRGEIRQTNTRLDALRTETNARFDALGKRLTKSEMRTATALTDVAGSIREMTEMHRSQGDLRPRVEKCEQDIAELKRRRG